MVLTNEPLALKSSEKVRTDVETTQLLLDDAFITKAAACVAAAKQRIWVCAYTWRWYANAPQKDIQRFNVEVARAARRGVDVRAIMHDPTQARYLEQYGFKTRKLQKKIVLHTKALFIDGHTLILGSHNLTAKGTEENFEASILSQDPEVLLQFETYFKAVWQNLTR